MPSRGSHQPSLVGPLATGGRDTVSLGNEMRSVQSDATDAYTDVQYLELMDRFKSEGIPLAVGVIDMDW